MIENLQKQYERTGKLLVIDAALEVAFTGESWQEVCKQAEEVTGAKPGLYKRICRRLDPPDVTLNTLVRDALESVTI